MENVVSIFSGTTPCDNLSMPNDEFYENLRSVKMLLHLSDCKECTVRFNILNRRLLAEQLLKAEFFEEKKDGET